MPRMSRLFRDHLVTATELNRRVGATLDMAAKTPVTITRNDQHFALLRRDVVAQLSAVADQTTVCLEMMRAVWSVLTDKQLPGGHPYRWIHVYDADDLRLLAEELMDALDEVIQGDDTEAVEGVIHEWYESAVAATSDVLEEAFSDDADPLPLSPSASDWEAADV